VDCLSSYFGNGWHFLYRNNAMDQQLSMKYDLQFQFYLNFINSEIYIKQVQYTVEESTFPIIELKHVVKVETLRMVYQSVILLGNDTSHHGLQQQIIDSEVRTTIRVPFIPQLSFRLRSFSRIVCLIIELAYLSYLHVALLGFIKVYYLDKLVCWMLLFQAYLSLSYQIMFLFNPEELCSYLNSIMMLDQKIRK